MVTQWTMARWQRRKSVGDILERCFLAGVVVVLTLWAFGLIGCQGTGAPAMPTMYFRETGAPVAAPAFPLAPLPRGGVRFKATYTVPGSVAVVEATMSNQEGIKNGFQERTATKTADALTAAKGTEAISKGTSDAAKALTTAFTAVNVPVTALVQAGMAWSDFMAVLKDQHNNVNYAFDFEADSPRALSWTFWHDGNAKPVNTLWVLGPNDPIPTDPRLDLYPALRPDAPFPPFQIPALTLEGGVSGTLPPTRPGAVTPPLPAVTPLPGAEEKGR